jgi:biopolymer transport protein ExbB/TolQ
MIFYVLGAMVWAFGVICSILIILMAFFAKPTTLPVFQNIFAHPVAPICILSLFIWVLIDVVLKYLQIRREYSWVAWFEQFLSKGNEAGPNLATLKSDAPRAAYRYKLIKESGQSKGTLVRSSIHESVPSAAVLDANRLSSSYVRFQVYAWILPVIGFVGTAYGMASAIRGFQTALLEHPGQIDVLINNLATEVIPGLAGAFGTTIVALVAAIVTHFCMSVLRNWDQETLDRLDHACLDHLSRVPLPEQASVEMLRHVALQLREIVQVPDALKSAERTISDAAKTVTTAGQQSIAALRAVAAAAEEVVATTKKLEDIASQPYQVTITRGRANE